MKRLRIAILFLLASFTHAFAQNKVIDSLNGVLKTEQEDTNKVNTLNVLSNRLRLAGKYDSVFICANSAEKLAEKLSFKSGLAVADMNQAIVCDQRGNYTKALEYAQKALSGNEAIENKEGVASNYNDIGNIYFAQNDYDKALDYYSRALAANREMGNKKGIPTDLCNIGNTYTSQGNYFKALAYYSEALNASTELGDKDGVARDLGNMGIAYYSQGNLSKALECYSKALTIDRKGDNKSQVADDLINIGNIYDDQNNSAKALEYYYNALAMNEVMHDKASVCNCVGNIGVIYAGRGNSDSALKYEQKALEIAKEIGDNDGVGSNLCNIGNVYRDKGNSAQALKHYFDALPILKSVGDKRFIISSYTNIGSEYIKLKNYKQAKVYLDSALNLSLTISEKDEMESIYISMAELDSATGNYGKALEDYKKYVDCRDSMLNQESLKKMTRMEVSFEYERREDSIQAEQEKTNIIKEAEIKRKNIITYSTIVIEILTGILAILFINRQQIRRKRDKILFEKEKQQMETELANAKLLLDEYLKSMLEKNQLLEQFKTDVENLKNLKAKIIDENRIENIENLNKATILTDEDWDKFKKLFEEAYKGFFVRLKEKLPDLTQAEIRLVCLTKLKLETKQMAGVLGVSADTIKKTRYRLRKKLGLSEEDSLDDISLSI